MQANHSTNVHKNEVHLAGVLAKDPELRHTATGKTVANLTVLTKYQDKSEYHRVTAWEKLAEKAGALHKGDFVQIVGRLQTRSWEDAAKVKRYSTEIDRSALPPARTFYEREGFRLGRPNSKGWAMAQGQPPCHKSESGKSFSINVDGGFYCHGCKTSGGDVVAYVQLRDQVDFKTAAQSLGAWDEAPSPETVHRLNKAKRERERAREHAAAVAELDRRRRLAIREQLHACSWAYSIVNERLSQLRLGAVPDWPDEQESCWATLQVTLGDFRKLDAEYCAAAGIEMRYEH